MSFVLLNNCVVLSGVANKERIVKLMTKYCYETKEIKMKRKTNYFDGPFLQLKFYSMN